MCFYTLKELKNHYSLLFRQANPRPRDLLNKAYKTCNFQAVENAASKRKSKSGSKVSEPVFQKRCISRGNIKLKITKDWIMFMINT